MSRFDVGSRYRSCHATWRAGDLLEQRPSTVAVEHPARVERVEEHVGIMFPGAHLTTHPDKPAVIMADTGWSQTYAELDAGANRLSQLFRSAGLQPGDHVALCLENHPRYFEILWGCEYAGLIYTAASSRLTTDELQYIVNDCGAKAFITSAYKAEQAAELRDVMPNVELRLMLDTTIDGYESYEEASRRSRRSRSRAGSPAPTCSTRRAPPAARRACCRRSPTQAIEERVTGVTMMCQLLFGVDTTKVYLSPAPLYHAAPLRFCMSHLAIGATVVVMEAFDPSCTCVPRSSTGRRTARSCRRCSCGC
jgi:long-chain acyl-CoA synthetase